MQVATKIHERERGFTIVEVLIGALLVTIVFAGAMYFIAGSGTTQQKSLVRQRMAAAADSITQQVRADDRWLTNACKTSECDVSSSFPVPVPKKGDPQLDASVKVRPIDSESDLTGVNDQDGVRPDFYRIQVTVTLPPKEQQKWGKQSPFESVSTVDATAIGRATGSLIVQTCEVVNQVDERVSIPGCDGGGGNRLDMNKQPSPCSSPFPLSWDGWMRARPVLPLGCNDAFKAADAKDSYLTTMHVRGATDVKFKLKRVGGGGGAVTVRGNADADKVSGNGTYVFSGIPSGAYEISVVPGAGRELWATKSVPSALRASVQANQEARALLVVRPQQGTSEYRARFTRATWNYELTTFKAEDTYEEEFTDVNGTTVRTRTTTQYVYLTSSKPKRVVWNGPAWNAIVSMEPKPFDRYRAGTVVSQPTIMAQWKPSNDPAGGWLAFRALPTGLHSLPTQQPTPQPAPAALADIFGDLGTRTQQCIGGTPGGSCGAFGWIKANGSPDSTVTWHSEDGECYIESSVAAYPIARRLQNGGGHAERCSRDLEYRNPKTGKVTTIKNFLPDKNGNGGSTLVLSMIQTTICLTCPKPVPPAIGTAGYPDPSSGGSNPSVGASTGTPPRTTAPPPKVTYTPEPPEPTPTNPTPPPPASVDIPAATAVPSAGGAGGGFKLTP